MNTPLSFSPIHEALKTLNAGLGSDANKAHLLGIADVSEQARAGVKGRGAADGLAALGLPIPTQPNTWNPLPDGGLIARLGLTEFLVEGDALSVHKMMQNERALGVYPVLRQDAAFALCGARVNELLLQTCNVDFRVLDAEPSAVVLTSMAGVGVTVLKRNATTYRIWCDGTYGIYLLETLAEIATELGGGLINNPQPFLGDTP
jgi:sarcosine oxidase subunit gamma